jgi:hypothetical protein
MTTNNESRKLEIKTAKREIRKYVRPHTVVYTVLRRVNLFGTARWMDVFVMHRNRPLRLTYYVATLLDYQQSAKDCSMYVKGCGMDMGWHVVYSLGCALWPKGTRKPHGERNGVPDSYGGYAFKHLWL